MTEKAFALISGDQRFSPVSYTFTVYCTHAVRVTGGVTRKRAYESSSFWREGGTRL